MRRVHEHPAAHIALLGGGPTRKEVPRDLFREIDEDRVRLPEHDVAIDEGRHPPGRVQLAIRLGLLFAGRKVHVLEAVLRARFLEREHDATRVGGHLEAVEDHHGEHRTRSPWMRFIANHPRPFLDLAPWAHMGVEGHP